MRGYNTSAAEGMPLLSRTPSAPAIGGAGGRGGLQLLSPSSRAALLSPSRGGAGGGSSSSLLQSTGGHRHLPHGSSTAPGTPSMLAAGLASIFPGSVVTRTEAVALATEIEAREAAIGVLKEVRKGVGVSGVL